MCGRMVSYQIGSKSVVIKKSEMKILQYNMTHGTLCKMMMKTAAKLKSLKLVAYKV